MSDLINSTIIDGVGTIELNRPRAINALNLEMLQGLTALLGQWQHDSTVREVILKGAGEKGFCSGADIRELAEGIRQGADWVGGLRLEYGVQKLIFDFPKPVTAHLFGIAMGGGLGTGAAASRRLVDATTTMAMPETKIGWFPDAGMMFWLSRAGAVGTHCALTSAVFGAGDAIAMGIADEAIDGSQQLAPLSEATWIQECYATDDASEIIQRLESHASSQARHAATDLRARSPFAVHVSLRKLRLSEHLTHAEVLAQDLEFSQRMLDVDFQEGVRALLIDKDNRPRWAHPRIEDVPAQLVDAVFGG